MAHVNVLAIVALGIGAMLVLHRDPSSMQNHLTVGKAVIGNNSTYIWHANDSFAQAAAQHWQVGEQKSSRPTWPGNTGWSWQLQQGQLSWQGCWTPWLNEQHLVAVSSRSWTACGQPTCDSCVAQHVRHTCLSDYHSALRAFQQHPAGGDELVQSLTPLDSQQSSSNAAGLELVPTTAGADASAPAETAADNAAANLELERETTGLNDFAATSSSLQAPAEAPDAVLLPKAVVEVGAMPAVEPPAETVSVLKLDEPMPQETIHALSSEASAGHVMVAEAESQATVDVACQAQVGESAGAAAADKAALEATTETADTVLLPMAVQAVHKTPALQPEASTGQSAVVQGSKSTALHQHSSEEQQSSFCGSSTCSAAAPDFAPAEQLLDRSWLDMPAVGVTSEANMAAGAAAAVPEAPPWPPGVYLTPAMAKAINQHGLAILLSVLIGACVLHTVCALLRQAFASKFPQHLLPLSVRKDPKKLGAYFMLHQMANQKLMWFRLLGVSGAAVAVADKALQQYEAVSSQAKGQARLARKYVRNTVQRYEQEKQQALLQQAKELQQEAALQLQSQAGAHAAALQAAAARHQKQQDVLQEQIDALQKQRQVDQKVISDLRAREKELAADARSKADVIAEQRATATSLHQQLVEVKSEKAGLSHELRQVRDQLAKEQGRVEAMLHEEQEVKGQAQTFSTKYESLQQQLSEIRSSNAQLTSEVAHLQAAHATAEASMAELRKEKQLLEDKREQLQQQLTSSNEQLAEARSQSVEGASKLLQMQERSTGQQEQIATLQAANGDLSGQLQQLQALQASTQAAILELQAKLTAADAQVAEGRASILQLQVQLQQLEQRAAELRAELGDSGKSNLQLRSDLQHLQTTHAAAEASIAELRTEKAAFAAKADELQQRLTSTAAEVAELRSHLATMVAQLQQQQDANHALQEQLEATKAKNKRQSADVSSLQQQLQALQQQLAHSMEQLTSEKQHLQQEIAEQQAKIAGKEEMIQQLTSGLQQEQATAAGLLGQLQELQSEHGNLVRHCEELDQQLDESVQLLGDREAQLQELQEHKAVLEGQVTALKSNLDTKTATLREAQASLSETEGKLHEEYEKNFDLGRENHALQQDLDRLTAEKEQMDQDLEEAIADRAALLDQYEELESSFQSLMLHAETMHAKTEGLLEENLDSRVELAGKLTAAQAGLTAVTQERDELAKKLYWAEIARDQHGAAKALAAADAIAARQALTEEKLLRSQASSPSPGPGASGGSKHTAAAASDGKEMPEGQRSLSRINSTGSKWATVKPGYLHQTIADRRTSSSSHAGTNSPSSPHASSPNAASAGAATSRSPSAAAGNKCSSAPCTPRAPEDGQDELSSPFLQQSSPLTIQQQQDDGTAAKQSAADAAALRPAAAVIAAAGVGVSPAGSSMCNTGSPIPSLLRKSASLPTLTAAEVQEYAAQQQLMPHEQQQQQRGEEGVAAAAEGLRRNFSDDGVTSPARIAAAAAAAARPASASDQRTSWQQQQQQPLPDSPQRAPPLEVSQSPSIRSSASRASRTDRSMLPLALSPVPFDLTCSNELGPSLAEACSSVLISSAPAAGAGTAVTAVPADDATDGEFVTDDNNSSLQQLPHTPAAGRQQQHMAHCSSEEAFFTPQPQINPVREAASRSSCGLSDGTAAASEGASPRGQSTPYFTPKAVPTVSGGSGMSPGDSSAVSSELDDEADVLIGSMSEAEFASVRMVGSVEGGVSRHRRSQQQQRQHSILAAEAAAAVAARRGETSRLSAAAPVQRGQQQQHAKLSKKQKKKFKQKQKKQAEAALHQQHSSDVGHSTGTVQANVEASTESFAAAGRLLVQQYQQQQQLGGMLLPEPSQEDSCVEYGARTADGQLTASLALEAETSLEDVSATRDLADSPPKCMLMAGAAAVAATNGTAAGNVGRYNSPLRLRTAIAATASSPLSSSPTMPAGAFLQLQQQHLPSNLGPGSCSSIQIAEGADVSLGHASSIGSAGSIGSGAGIATSRLRNNTQAGRLGSPRYSSPNRTSCSSIKSLVAQSRLRDADSPSSGGSSCRSPQRFRAKFGVSPSHCTAAQPAAAAMLPTVSSCDAVALVGTCAESQGRQGLSDQDLRRSVSAVLGDTHACDVLLMRGSGELPLYRTSVQWKALSDSLTAASEPLPGLRSKSGSGSNVFGAGLVAAAVAAAAGSGSPEVGAVGGSEACQDWKIAENLLYFER